MAGQQIGENSSFPIDERPDEFLVKSFVEEGQAGEAAAAQPQAGGSSAQPLERLDDYEAFLESAPAETSAAAGAAAAAVTNWRPAKSLVKLKEQVNAAFPNRSKASDGMIGDDAHCGGNGSSDHCPNVKDGNVGVVTAFDVTHDPGNGCDADQITKAIVHSKDSRVKYIIYNKKIVNSKSIGSSPPWTWRPYNGANPHTKHFHLSVLPSKAQYDDTSSWTITGGAGV